MVTTSTKKISPFERQQVRANDLGSSSSMRPGTVDGDELLFTFRNTRQQRCRKRKYVRPARPRHRRLHELESTRRKRERERETRLHENSSLSEVLPSDYRDLSLVDGTSLNGYDGSSVSSLGNVRLYLGASNRVGTMLLSIPSVRSRRASAEREISPRQNKSRSMAKKRLLCKASCTKSHTSHERMLKC